MSGRSPHTHTHIVNEERLVACVEFPEVNYEFFCVCSVEDEVVSRAPLGQVFDILPVGGLINTCDKSDRSSVICEHNNRVSGKCWCTVRGV